MFNSCCGSLINHCAGAIPTSEERANSHYKVDDKDHSGRLISLYDLGSQFYQLGKGVLQIVLDLIKGIGALLAMIILLPASYFSEGAEMLKQALLPYLTDIYSPVRNNERAFFLCVMVPKHLIKIACNSVGIFLPEVGRLGRRMETSQALSESQRVEMLTYMEWKNSTYKIDQEDHTGRLICLVDIISQAWQVVTVGIHDVVIPLIKGVVGLVGAILLVPLDYLTSRWNITKITDLKNGALGWTENLAIAPCNFVVYMVLFLPQIFIKISGNAIGVAIPEVGRAVRRWERIKFDQRASEIQNPHLPDTVPERSALPDAVEEL
jgi:hypothetical protein